MTLQEIFTARLRRHRERNGIPLDEIAAATCIKRELLESFEGTDLSAWPQGLYARAWVRAYASAIGLDPIDTVDEFCRLFPQGNRRLRVTIEEIAAIVAAPSSVREDLPAEIDGDRRQPPARINMLASSSWATALGRLLRALRGAARVTSRSASRRSARRATP